MFITNEKFKQILDIVNKAFPEWQGFKDERFTEQEIIYKNEATKLAQELLNKDIYQDLLNRSEFDLIIENIEKVAHKINLLFLSMPRNGDLNILYHENLNKETFCQKFFDLLHLEGDFDIRFGDYLNFIKNQNLPNKWTFPTYFLFLLNPAKYFFIKPSVVKWFLKFIDFDKSIFSEPTVDSYKSILSLVNEMKEIFKDYHPTNNIDIQSLIWVLNYTIKEVTDAKEHYWVIAPGENARLWNDFVDNKICAIGWNEMGDLSKFTSLEEIKIKMIEVYGADSSYVNNGLACYEFVHKLKIGDFLFAKKGRNQIIGFGKVTSDFFFDENRTDYKNCREVDWIKTGSWTTKEKAGVKTLTDITKYTDYVKTLLHLVNEIDPPPPTNKNIWWLNANPKIWRLADMKVGEREEYTTYTGQGTKRRIYKNFKDLTVGDLLIGYISTPDKIIDSLCEIKGLTKTDDDNEIIKFEFEKKEVFQNPVSWSELQTIPELKECEPMINNQGSLFKVTNEEYDIIRGLIDEKNPPIIKVQSYTKENALSELFIEKEQLENIINMLKYKKNIILQGAPGVGKTFIAKRIAYCMMGVKDNDRVRMIQFHQSYSYEDFIQGYRPNDEGGFERKEGIFYDFCKKAQRNPGKDYFFIIDEINRGNLSKIFGELMMLIEKDKRGSDFAIPLTYSKNEDEIFYLPENLHFIGTMNTADRSLAMVDYALRRRFGFVSLAPAFKNPKYREHLKQKKVPETIINKIIDKMENLNSAISKDTKNLGEGYQIGHSYFCPDFIIEGAIVDDWYKNIIKNEIEPLLMEYWFDNPDKVRDEIKSLLEL